MAISNWEIFIQDSFETWISDGTVPRPNEDLPITDLSTQRAFSLADGSKGFVTPETKKQKQPITFIWVADDGTLKTKLDAYLAANEYVRIVTHTGEEFIGRFISLTRVWLVGIAPDEYDWQVIFERQE